MKLRYFKAFWNESRGDKYDHWGTSWWFFKVHSDDSVIEQFEIYSNGVAGWYADQHIEDEYGGLAAVRWSEFASDTPVQKISRSEFETTRNSSNFINTDT